MKITHLVRHEIAGRIFRHLSAILFTTAALWRSMLFRTRFIAITGSLGKTTTKQLLGEILSTQYPTFVSIRNQNANRLVALNLLRVRPWHRFAVIELGTAAPGKLISAARLVRPHIAVITSVAEVHIQNYRDIDEIAVEKLTLLDALEEGGIAVVNGSDPRLASLRRKSGCRVIRFGESTRGQFDLNAFNFSARWPDRLKFNVFDGLNRYSVKTNLVGDHWYASVLAALLAAQACGVPLEESIVSIRSIKPFDARLQPVCLPNGAVVIRDEYNGSKATYQQSLKVLAEARANRKILIASDLSDDRSKPKQRLRILGRWAFESCDLAVFIGEHTHHARRGAENAGMPPEAIRVYSDLESAAEFVRNELRKGDLVLLKGRTSNHLTRILYALVGDIRCKRPVCPETFLCDICWRLGASQEARSKLVPI